MRASIKFYLKDKNKHNNHAKAGSAGRWNTKKMISSEGYVKIRVGKSHPLADSNGYVYEHKLVVISAYGIGAIKGEIIHHINGDKTDNRLENLDLKTRGSHNRHHNQEKGRDLKGRFIGKKKAGHLLDGKELREMP